MDGAHPAEQQFRTWLGAGLSGCYFAARFARGAEHLSFYQVIDDPPEDLAVELDAFFERAAEDGRVPIALFPRIRSAVGTARLIRILRSGARWSAKTVPWGNYPRHENACLVGLEWTTASSLRSQVMGFAPLGSMPVTRRAPYVAVTAWPGGHDNEYFSKGHPKRVSFADASPHLRDRRQYDELWKKSETQTRTLTSDPADDVERMRRVAFCLPRIELLREDPGLFK